MGGLPSWRILAFLDDGRGPRHLLHMSRLLRIASLCGLASVVALFTFHIEPSRACQLCTPFPQASTADHLLSADAVVLTREDPDRPFHLAPVEVLQGDPGDQKIDLFLDSAARRLLAKKPDRSVVVTLTRADCGAENWRRIGMADDDFGPVVRRILASAEDLRSAPESRFDFFEEWLGHSNTQLQTLAHIEIARAPYDRILECRDTLSRETIYGFLNNVRYIEWHPLYILILAAKDHPDDRELIRRSFQSGTEFSTTTTLGAWTTAYIEIAEAEAIAAVEKHYFRRGGRSPEELKAVLQALSVHGTTGHVHLRDRILQSYAVMLERYPERAADLIVDLKAWKRRDLSPAIAAIVSDPPSSMEPEALQQLRGYRLQQMRSNLMTARSPLLP